MNRLGFSMHTIAVVDEFHNGVPCVTIISSAEKASDIKRFLEIAQDKADVKFKKIMMDKSATEIKAVTDLGIMHLLCIFHMCQDWDRFLKSTKACLGS